MTYSPRLPSGIRNGMRESSTFGGNVVISGNLDVGGDETIGGTLDVTGDTTLADVYADAVYVAGGTAAAGVASAGDVVIGDGTGSAGQTIFVDSVAGIGAVWFAEASATIGGGMRYLAASNRLDLAAAGAIQVQVLGTGLFPNSTGAKYLGSAGLEWLESHVGVSYVDGADSGDAPAGADELVIGDGSTSVGVTLFVDAAGDGSVVITDTGGSSVAGWRYEHDNLRHVWWSASADIFRVSGASMGPLVSSMDLGTSSNPFDNAFFDAASTVTVGDGSDDPHIVVAKGATTDNDAFYFAAGGTAASNYSWAFNHDASENFAIARWSSGSEVDQPFSIAHATGDVTVLSNLNCSTGDIDAQAGQVKALAGLVAGDGSSYGSTIHCGSGAPGAGLGSNGDFYFRSDGVVASSPVIYHKEAGSWVQAV